MVRNVVRTVLSVAAIAVEVRARRVAAVDTGGRSRAERDSVAPLQRVDLPTCDEPVGDIGGPPSGTAEFGHRAR